MCCAGANFFSDWMLFPTPNQQCQMAAAVHVLFIIIIIIITKISWRHSELTNASALLKLKHQPKELSQCGNCWNSTYTGMSSHPTTKTNKIYTAAATEKCHTLTDDNIINLQSMNQTAHLVSCDLDRNTETLLQLLRQRLARSKARLTMCPVIS